jgi:hypothetical protein
MIRRNGYRKYEESEPIGRYGMDRKKPPSDVIDRKPRKGNGVWDDESTDSESTDKEIND